mmetsp:Transcript_12225/g.37684  ORF Transcript_12225/g.37684 Transcript_12225/m.37684 type:complete len:245 (+) Transcript_12225:364-1098(+)
MEGVLGESRDGAGVDPDRRRQPDDAGRDAQSLRDVLPPRGYFRGRVADLPEETRRSKDAAAETFGDGRAARRYRVRTTVTENGSSEEFETTRRFSEFASLREALVQRYVGLLVPPIPPKAVKTLATMSAKEGEKQTLQRLRVLNLFVERLATLPWCADDVVLKSFCGVAKQSFQRVLEGDHDADVEGESKGRAAWYARPAPESSSPREIRTTAAAKRGRSASCGRGAAATRLRGILPRRASAGD